MRRSFLFLWLGWTVAAGVAVAQTHAPAPGAGTKVIPAGVLAGSYLGVGIAEIDSERAKILKLKDESGVEITRVDPESPADRAGLKAGDVVLEFSGQKVIGIEQFSRLVRETPPGREIKLQVSRDGNVQTIGAKVAARKVRAWGGEPIPVIAPGMDLPQLRIPDMPKSYMSWRSAVLGVEAEALDGQLAEYFGVKQGVLVRTVTKGSVAERTGLRAGDVIVKVDDSRVVTPGDISGTIRSLGSKRTFPVVIVRDKREMTVTVTLEADGVKPLKM